MRVALLILCLCYLLFGGYNYLYTGKHQHSYARSLHVEKSYQKFTNDKQVFSVVKAMVPEQSGAYLLPDVEDEDPDNISARKFRLLASCFYILTAAFIITFRYNLFKYLPHAVGHLRNKYITQRVLRI